MSGGELLSTVPLSAGVAAELPDPLLLGAEGVDPPEGLVPPELGDGVGVGCGVGVGVGVGGGDGGGGGGGGGGGALKTMPFDPVYQVVVPAVTATTLPTCMGLQLHTCCELLIAVTVKLPFPSGGVEHITPAYQAVIGYGSST